MAFRVAVASSDGKYVNQHFGRATQFLIFEINEENYEFFELRQNQPSCSWDDPDENRHNQTIEQLDDCVAVIVSRIGPGAVEKLRLAGIEAYVIPDFIDEALQKLIDQKKC